MGVQLELFRQRLPQRPYNTDELGFGLRISGRDAAMERRYIQQNGPTHKFWLVFDVDRAGGGIDWKDRECPAPSFSVINPDNQHAHLVYGLDVPVRTAPDGSAKALRYAAAVESELREKLGADVGYAGLVCKNPLHKSWRLIEGGRSYDLAELSEWVDINRYSDRRRKLPAYGLGRNCELFESLRQWAYKAIRQGWPDYNQWLAACQDRAVGLNQFDAPLPTSEVKATAKSVAKWTFKHLTQSGFSQWQAVQGAKGGTAKGLAYAEKAAEARRMRAEGLTQAAIAAQLGVHVNSVAHWIKTQPTNSHIR